MSGTALAAKLAGTSGPFAATGVLLDVVVFGHSLFGIIGPILVVAIAGLFTIRSSVAKIWRENYEAETERSALLERERDEQRELKHAALTDLAAINGLLAVERAKTDLSPVVSALGQQRALLEQIRDGLANTQTTREAS